MRPGEPVMFLKFIVTGSHRVCYIAPHHVTGIEDLGASHCAIHVVGGKSWVVEGSAAEAQLRIWKALLPDPGNITWLEGPSDDQS